MAARPPPVRQYEAAYCVASDVLPTPAGPDDNGARSRAQAAPEEIIEFGDSAGHS